MGLPVLDEGEQSLLDEFLLVSQRDPTTHDAGSSCNRPNQPSMTQLSPSAW
jgi:hypothetical protein